MHASLLARLRAIKTALLAAYDDSGAPTAISGYVREQTFRQLVLPCIPMQYRVSSGHIIDQFGARTGQIDSIVENGLFPSVPAPSIADVRLVIAEGAALVIEVKSTLPSQWEEVVATALKIAPIRRNFRGNDFSARGVCPPQLPLYAVGYQGWERMETLRNHLRDGVSGILTLRPTMFAGVIYDDVVTGTEEAAIWAFISAVHFKATQILSASCDLFEYARIQ